jgi:hypothetical protein
VTQLYLFLHLRKVDLILRHIRDNSEPGSVAPYQRIQLRQFKHIFSSLTHTEILTFHDKDGQDLVRPLTYIKDPVEFKASIASMRNKENKTVVTKYGLDNGQVYILYTLCILILNPNRVSQNSHRC